MRPTVGGAPTICKTTTTIGTGMATTTTTGIHNASSAVVVAKVVIGNGYDSGTNNTPSSSTSSPSTSMDHPHNHQRVLVVRYYLDRPGYDIQNSSSRLWMDPPRIITPHDIATFLDEQGIVMKQRPSSDTTTTTTTLVEIYLDQFGSFMWLEACAEHNVQLDYTNITMETPGVLNIRLTDLCSSSDATNSNPQQEHIIVGQPTTQYCSTSPVGLFAFSMTICLESLYGLQKLSDVVDPSYLLTYSPYALFVSGLLQFVVGWNEIRRNNIYGATAFMAFGCFWLANGTKLILTTYFPEQIPDVILASGGPGKLETFIREVWITLFVVALFKQTLILNKVTTALISVLLTYLIAASLGPWHEAFEWIKVGVGFGLSIFAYMVFYAELTNEVYHRSVYNLYPWTIHSPEEVFGAAGRNNTLQSHAIALRTAQSMNRGSSTSHNNNNDSGKPFDHRTTTTYQSRAASRRDVDETK